MKFQLYGLMERRPTYAVEMHGRVERHTPKYEWTPVMYLDGVLPVPAGHGWSWVGVTYWRELWVLESGVNRTPPS